MSWMRLVCSALLLAGAAQTYADDMPIALAKLQLVTEQGAEAKLEVTAANGSEPAAAVVTVSKTGSEFWSVELRAPGLNWQQGVRYQLKFRAKATPESYIYVVPERDGGAQFSVALGTMLQIPAAWTDCTVSFAVTVEGTPGRLTISELSVNPAVFAFSDFVLTRE
jgi:hypothetical protein